jgi:hypothetical protein
MKCDRPRVPSLLSPRLGPVARLALRPITPVAATVIGEMDERVPSYVRVGSFLVRPGRSRWCGTRAEAKAGVCQGGREPPAPRHIRAPALVDPEVIRRGRREPLVSFRRGYGQEATTGEHRAPAFRNCGSLGRNRPRPARRHQQGAQLSGDTNMAASATGRVTALLVRSPPKASPFELDDTAASRAEEKSRSSPGRDPRVPLLRETGSELWGRTHTLGGGAGLARAVFALERGTSFLGRSADCLREQLVVLEPPPVCRTRIGRGGLRSRVGWCCLR